MLWFELISVFSLLDFFFLLWMKPGNNYSSDCRIACRSLRQVRFKLKWKFDNRQIKYRLTPNIQSSANTPISPEHLNGPTQVSSGFFSWTPTDTHREFTFNQPPKTRARTVAGHSIKVIPWRRLENFPIHISLRNWVEYRLLGPHWAVSMGVKVGTQTQETIHAASRCWERFIVAQWFMVFSNEGIDWFSFSAEYWTNQKC